MRAQIMAAKVKEREEENKNRGAPQGKPASSKLVAASSTASSNHGEALPSGMQKGDWN